MDVISLAHQADKNAQTAIGSAQELHRRLVALEEQQSKRDSLVAQLQGQVQGLQHELALAKAREIEAQSRRD